MNSKINKQNEIRGVVSKAIQIQGGVTYQGKTSISIGIEVPEISISELGAHI